MVGYCVARRFLISLFSNKPSIYGKVVTGRFILNSQFSTNSFRSKQPLLLLTVAGVGVGTLLGGGYSFYVIQQGAPVANEDVGTTGSLLNNFPDVSVSRRVFNAADTSRLQLTLFQYPTCPFCCKVRAFLNFHGITYDVVEVNPVLRQQMSWSEYKKVPIILAKVENGYQQMNDSSMIVSALSSYLEDPNADLSEIINCYPSISYRDDDGVLKKEVVNRYFLMFNREVPKERTKELEEERKWRQWADNVLVHTLSPNVYRTREEAMQAFIWFSEVGEWDRLFSNWERNLIVYVGAYAMLIIGKRLKKRHNLKDDVRQSLYDECNNWMKAIRNKDAGSFMGGSQPSLADLAVYGVLSSIEGCTAFSDLLQNTKIGLWYWPMKKLVQANTGVVIT